MRFDWLLTGAVAAGALWSAHRFLADVSRHLAGRWRSFQRQPFWVRWVLWTALLWVALRLLRFGWRPFLVYGVVLGGVLLWAAGAARGTRA